MGGYEQEYILRLASRRTSGRVRLVEGLRPGDEINHAGVIWAKTEQYQKMRVGKGMPTT